MNDLERERRALTLFEAMLELDEAARAAWLEANAGDDEALRHRVSELASADRFVEMQTGGAFADAAADPPPERIGAYQIEGVIGSGGMGTVYAARRDRGDFDHEVAIKLVKPGLLGRTLLARFTHERQVLARFSHPNIARLFDGGETEDGQPFIVMEKVEGVSLAQWLERESHPREECLQLFLKICSAVGHAHRHAIIHRDLTPANILVEPGGEPKLIDFGIARPEGEEDQAGKEDRAGEDTKPGIAAHMPLQFLTLTPGYAAPERLRGAGVTTLTDIYSAGRVLKHLLTKPRPFELEAIANKALADDPAERYQSIEALAEDVRRFLERRTVEALPRSTLYALRKWFQRNAALGTLAALLFAAILAGGSISLWNWIEAERAREREQQRFEETRGIANFMLYDLYDTLDATPGNTVSLARIADEARGYLERLARVGSPPPDLRLEIAQGYHRLSGVSGNPERSNLGRRDDARRFIDRAIADLERLHAEHPARADYTRALAAAHYSDAILRFIGEDDNAGALRAGDRSAALYAALVEAQGDDADRVSAIRSKLQAAKALVWLERGAEGVERLTRLRREVEGETARRPNNREVRRLLAAVNSELNNTSAWHYDPADPGYAAGLEAADRAVAIYRDMIASSATGERRDLENAIVAALYQRAQARGDVGLWPGALADVEEAIAIIERFVRLDRGDDDAVQRLETLRSQQVYALLEVGRTAEAIEVSRGLTQDRVRRSARNPDNPGFARNAAGALSGFAEALERVGRSEESCRVRRQALEQWEAVDRRWRLSTLDRKGTLAETRAAVERCRTAL